MAVLKAYFTDDNRTRIRGYREIGIEYRLLWEAIAGGRLLRASYLAGPVQARCWKYALSGDLQRAADTFINNAMIGETEEHARWLAENVFFEDGLIYRIVRKAPKFGKLLDTAPVPGANEALRAAHEKRIPTAILSMGFREFIGAHLRKHGYMEDVDRILANGLLIKNGKIAGIDRKVVDKGESIEELFDGFGLNHDGSGVAYGGDEILDLPALERVEYAFISPIAKPKVRDELEGRLTDKGRKVLIPKDYREVVNKFGLD